MDKKAAKKIYSMSQQCLSEMNEALKDIKADLTDDEFIELRQRIAQIMGQLVEVCEIYVYSDFPDMRPYSLDKS